MNRKTIGALAAYLACIPLANWMIGHVGTVQFPGGPHTIPVGFGYVAPSGVLLIGAALAFRDAVQRWSGKVPALVAIVIGIGLSYLVNPAIATASAVAFGLGELADFAVFTPLAARAHVTYVTRSYKLVTGEIPGSATYQHVYRPRWMVAAVITSGVVGGVIDTFVFLQIAFGSTDYWQGQVIGKTAMAALGGLIIWGARAVPQWLSSVES
tara:strand:- start:617 stop:1249 length:633 start_codon:yes stop_codon:yes gene_type:complete